MSTGEKINLKGGRDDWKAQYIIYPWFFHIYPCPTEKSAGAAVEDDGVKDEEPALSKTFPPITTKSVKSLADPDDACSNYQVQLEY